MEHTHLFILLFVLVQLTISECAPSFLHDLNHTQELDISQPQVNFQDKESHQRRLRTEHSTKIEETDFKNTKKNDNRDPLSKKKGRIIVENSKREVEPKAGQSQRPFEQTSPQTTEKLSFEDRLLETQVRMFLDYLGKKDANEEGLAEHMERMENNYDDMVMMERRAEDLEEKETSRENIEERGEGKHKIVKRNHLDTTDGLSLIMPMVDITSMIGEASDNSKTISMEDHVGPKESVTAKDTEFRTVITFEEKIGTPNETATEAEGVQITSEAPRQLTEAERLKTEQPSSLTSTRSPTGELSLLIEEETSTIDQSRSRMEKEKSAAEQLKSLASTQRLTTDELRLLNEEETPTDQSRSLTETDKSTTVQSRSSSKTERSTTEQSKLLAETETSATEKLRMLSQTEGPTTEKTRSLTDEKKSISEQHVTEDHTTKKESPNPAIEVRGLEEDISTPDTKENIDPPIASNISSKKDGLGTEKELETISLEATTQKDGANISTLKDIGKDLIQQSEEGEKNPIATSAAQVDVVSKSKTSGGIETTTEQYVRNVQLTEKDIKDQIPSTEVSMIKSMSMSISVSMREKSAAVDANVTTPETDKGGNIQIPQITSATQPSLTFQDARRGEDFPSNETTSATQLLQTNVTTSQIIQNQETISESSIKDTETIQIEHTELSEGKKETDGNTLSPLPLRIDLDSNKARKVDLQSAEVTAIIESENTTVDGSTQSSITLKDDFSISLETPVTNNTDVQTQEDASNSSVSESGKTNEDNKPKSLSDVFNNISTPTNKSTTEVVYLVYSTVANTEDTSDQTAKSASDSKNETISLDATIQSNNNQNETNVNSTTFEMDSSSEKELSQNITTVLSTEATLIRNTNEDAELNVTKEKDGVIDNDKGKIIYEEQKQDLNRTHNTRNDFDHPNQITTKDINKFKLRPRPIYDKPVHSRKILGPQKIPLTNGKNVTTKDESKTHKQMINSRRIAMDKMNSHVIEDQVEKILTKDVHRFSGHNKNRNNSNTDQKHSPKDGNAVRQKSEHSGYEDIEEENTGQIEKDNNEDGYVENVSEQTSDQIENTNERLMDRLVQMRKDKIKNSYIKTLEKHKTNASIKNLKSNDLKSRINAMIDRQNLEENLEKSRQKFTNLQKLNESDEDGGVRQRIKYTPLRTPKPGFKIPVDQLFAEENPSNDGHRRRFTPTNSKNTNFDTSNSKSNADEEEPKEAVDPRPKKTFNRKSTAVNSQSLLKNLMTEKSTTARPQFKPSTSARKPKTTTTESPVEFETESEIETENTSIETTESLEKPQITTVQQKPINKNVQANLVREPSRLVTNNSQMRTKPTLLPVKRTGTVLPLTLGKSGSNQPIRITQGNKRVPLLVTSTPQPEVDGSEESEDIEIHPEIEETTDKSVPQTSNLKDKAQTMNKGVIQAHEHSRLSRPATVGSVIRKYDVRSNLSPRLFKMSNSRNTENTTVI